jgi:hypothetical protein
MSGMIDPTIMDILKKAVEQANLGHKIEARAYFYDILTLDPNNEYALLWQAYLSDDPYKAIGFLERLLKLQPGHKSARAYLNQAKQRCDELEKRQKSSIYVNSFNPVNNSSSKSGLAVPYLGDYLVQQGLITSNQLEMALRLHRDLKERGHPKPIGRVLIELGYINNDQLNRWLQQQNDDLENFYLRN